MKIAIEAQRLFRKKKHGMDIVALELIRHLQEIDYENEYFIMVKPDEDNDILSETDNFHIIEISGGPYPLWEQYYLPKALKKIKPDILHCTSNTAPLFTKIPLILTLHDILYMQKIDFTKGTWYQRLGNLYRKWVVPRIVHSCRKIITVSNFEKDEIDTFFSLPPHHVEVVYNSYNSHFRQTIKQESLQSYKQKYHLPERFILYLGNTHPNKNIVNVLKAMSLLHQENDEKIPLVMPDIDKAFLKRILLEINNPGLKNFIYLTGYVPNHELKYIYNLATIFLYPSFYESFGIPILEAMACGTPVITSDKAAMPEVAHNSAIIIDPGKPTNITKAIKTLLTDPALYLHYKEAGLKRSSSFSWETTANQIMAIYKEVGLQTVSSKIKKQLV